MTLRSWWTRSRQVQPECVTTSRQSASGFRGRRVAWHISRMTPQAECPELQMCGFGGFLVRAGAMCTWGEGRWGADRSGWGGIDSRSRRGGGGRGGGGKRHIPPHSAQPRHTNDWAPRMRKRHQREHRPQRPIEHSDPMQHAEGRTGDCPGPRKETATRRNVTQGGGGGGGQQALQVQARIPLLSTKLPRMRGYGSAGQRPAFASQRHML